MRSRGIASVALIVVAAVLLLVGTVTYYARTEMISGRAFVGRAVAALDRSDVRDVAGREIVVRLVDRGSTDLVAARPLLQTVVDAALTTAPFKQLYRRAARAVHSTLFVRGDENATFDLNDVGQVVAEGMRAVSPKLARDIPTNLDAPLMSLREQPVAAKTLSIADDIRVLGIVLPLVAIAGFAAGIALTPDRRIGLLRSGVAVGAAGALLAVVLVLLRARLLAGLNGTEELTQADVRAAAGGVYDAALGDLSSWALAIGLVGVVIAGAAAALDREREAEAGARLRHLLERPASTSGRAARGLVALGLGVFAVWNPGLALHVLAIAGGAVLLFVGASELLALLPRRAAGVEEARHRRAHALATAGIAAIAVLAAAGGATALVLTATGGREGGVARAAGSGRACNGSVALCSLRLNEVVFAGTHNSFSAADSPGWYIANQRRTIGRQLDDGIRLFLLDTHWGVEGSDGHVRTDFGAEGTTENRVAKKLSHAELRVAENVAGGIGLRPSGNGKRDVWMCHTVCELGASRLLDALVTYRKFLAAHRGEVVILFIEPYVPASAFAAVAKQAGLTKYIATLDRSKPLPTLGELVQSGKRVIVFTERGADGTDPWYLDGFSFIQDTPLGAQKVSQLSCARNRGTADSPLLMLNHWADVFPPRRSANKPFLRESFVLQRAHECARERGQPVNLIAVDHYDQGGLIDAVRKLNEEQVRAVARG
jgi:hypothetical protein